jgi:hypothetical protein
MDRKSKESLDTAQLLLDKKLFTQSVHCAYYAVLQFMSYKLTTAKNPISYIDQNNNIHSQGSSHEYLFFEIKKRLSSINPKIAKDFQEDFRDLKANRVDADYSQRQFNDEDGCDCKAQAERLINKLNRI